MDDDNTRRTNGEALDDLIKTLNDALNSLPLPTMYHKEKRGTMEALHEQAAFVGAFLCDLGNGLQRIGFDPLAIAAAMELTGKAGKDSILEEIRNGNMKKPQATPDARKPFVVYGNTTLN